MRIKVLNHFNCKKELFNSCPKTWCYYVQLRLKICLIFSMWNFQNKKGKRMLAYNPYWIFTSFDVMHNQVSFHFFVLNLSRKMRLYWNIHSNAGNKPRTVYILKSKRVYFDQRRKKKGHLWKPNKLILESSICSLKTKHLEYASKF